MANSTLIGLKNAVYAIMTQDTAIGVSYQAPKPLADAMDAKRTPKTNSEVIYADDGPSEVITVLAETTLELGVKYLTLEAKADLQGHSILGGILIKKSTDIPPYVAIGFKNRKSNGKYVYVWLLKGKFDELETENQTLEAKANPKYPKLKGMFIKRTYDDIWEREADEDSLTYAPTIAANWFTAVENPDVIIPTISSTIPANNAVGVAGTSTFQWIFSEAMDSNTISTNTLYLIKDSDGSIVPGAMTYNSGTFTATFAPTSSLSVTSKYIAVATADVADLDGIHIVPVNKQFTTV